MPRLTKTALYHHVAARLPRFGVTRRIFTATIVATMLAGCGGGELATETVLDIDAVPDPGAPGSEAYFCYGRDAAPLGGLPIRRVTLESMAGPVVFHHIQLFAVTSDFPDGPVLCEGIPEHSIELDVIAPTGPVFELPAGVGLALPAGTRRLVAQVHVLRVGSGAAGPMRVEVHASSALLLHLAGYLRVGAPVPAMRPHSDEKSSALCHVAGPLHAVASWPHMHRLGTVFHGAIVRAGGSREPLVDVAPWNFDEQRVYRVSSDLAAGDAVETSCAWRNDGDQYVFPGPKTENEMCSQAIIAWPVESALCTDSRR